MNAIKTMMGLVMLGLAMSLAAPFIPNGFIPWAWGLILTLGLWGVYQQTSLPSLMRRSLLALLSVALIVQTSIMILQHDLPSGRWPWHLGQNHHPSLAFESITTLDQLQQVQSEAKLAQQPVIIDFYASWCVPCLQMDENTFSHPMVQRALEPYRRLRIDVSQGLTDDLALLQHFQLFGPPAVIALSPEGHLDWTLIGYEKAPLFLKRLSAANPKNKGKPI
jgi:thiol:disulfide interchange protein DsbD